MVDGTAPEDVLFLTGDLFQPLIEAQQQNPATLKPQVVYFLPPQDEQPADFDTSLEKVCLNIHFYWQ